MSNASHDDVLQDLSDHGESFNTKADRSSITHASVDIETLYEIIARWYRNPEQTFGTGLFAAFDALVEDSKISKEDVKGTVAILTTVTELFVSFATTRSVVDSV